MIITNKEDEVTTSRISNERIYIASKSKGIMNARI